MVVHLSLRGCVCHPQHLDKYLRKEETRIPRDDFLKLRNKVVACLRVPMSRTNVACNLRTCAVCRLHGAKYAVCRLHGTQSADCMVTVQTKDPSKTCDSFSKFQRNLRFSARINFLTKLPNLKENNLCLFDNGYYSFSCF